MFLGNDFAENATQAITSATDRVFSSTCYNWSTRRRIMGNPIPGNYGTKYHPWCKEILDSKATYNVTLKSAQGGFTEVGINRSLWNIDIKKKNVLYVLPTSTNASDFSKDRFGGALELSPYLKSVFTNTNSIGLKQSGANSLYIRGSRSDSALKSVPASVLVLDEFDEMSQRAVSLAIERLSGQFEKEIWFISTPTIPGVGVSKEYPLTTQEVFTFKCPCCSRSTDLVFPDCLEMCGEHVNDPDIYRSFIKCKECGSRLHHENKWEWLADGIWVPTHTNGDPDRRGFSMNQLYSSTVSPAEMMVGYLRGLTDEYAATEFNNSKLGRAYIGDSAQLSDDIIDQAFANHTTNDPRPVVGDRGRIITMGIDQGKVGNYVVVEWFVDQIGNDLNANAVAKVLDFGKWMQQSEGWGRIEELMREWQVLYAVVDADPEISDARRFAKKFYKHAGLSRYRGSKGKELAVTEEDTGAPMITCDRTQWIDMALGRFRNRTVSLPANTSSEFREHMKHLVKRYSKDELGNPDAQYVKIGEDHYAHCLVYAELALPFAVSGSSGRELNSLL